MTTFHDDKHSFPSSHQVPIYDGADFPAHLVSDTVTSLNPALAYLLSLNSARSRRTMVSVLNIVARVLGASDLSDCNWAVLRRHHVLALTEMLRDAGLAVATVNTYLSALRGVAMEAWMLKLMHVEDYQHIRAVRSVRGSTLPRGRALSREEIRELFMVCGADRSSKGPRDAALLAVLLGCGLRRSEAVALNYENILTGDRALKVLGKGNKERMAYIPAGTWQRLELWTDQVRGEHPGPLFTRIRRHDVVTDDRLTDQAVYHILQERQREAGLEKCAPHDLRRTFATAMLDNGEDLITLKDAMGHASVTTTQKYDRRGEDKLRRARDRLIIS
ncbi:Site-specific recombinase XerD [Kosakonia arachidis]|uniref:Site-specific recombinase XerD n=1 Tax=Kosakonia arachidis TaxID=551989 RepID=A0A1I7E9M3_9ENTR|nr:tyrosine-type recombinase/integrase [Kosakonia arachidis]SFU20621.1 Site-specific recombinase XerD [Kosakonia arachidis]